MTKLTKHNTTSPAVFLDRDGTLIEDRGDLRDISEAVFFPETFDALRRLQDFYLLFIVTNQSGIGKGSIRATDADKVNAFVVTRLQEEGVHIRDVYCCPHRRDELCACIKPKPYFLERAAREYDLDLSRSFSVGDHPHDVFLAENAGGIGIYVLTGHGEKHRDELPPDRIIMPGIREATDWIMGRCKEEERKQKKFEGAAGAAAP